MKSLPCLLIGLLLMAGPGPGGVTRAFAGGGHAHDADHGHGNHATGEGFVRGPHGGRLLVGPRLQLELAIFEEGVAPQFRAWVQLDGKAVDPADVRLEVLLHRLGGGTDLMQFEAADAYLRSRQLVAEPHSFDVEVRLAVNALEQRWHYESHEGRVRIAPEMAQAMGVVTAVAGAGELEITRRLTGRVHVDPGRVSRVRARYPGLIQSLSAEPWSEVERGQVLARVQSSDSLQGYPVVAPIGGRLVSRSAQVGEVTGDAPLFVIADLDQLWIEFDVFDHDLGVIATGQEVRVTGLHGERLAEGRIDMLSPLAIHAAQSVRARVVVDNRDRALRPGQYVSGEVVIERRPASLVVPRTALQQFRDFTVAYERVGEQYEVRMLELGDGDATQVEVLGGLRAGAEIVTRNSYLIKADIEKSGASHDH